MNASTSAPLARRLRGALFQLRAIFVFVALAVGIVLWMLGGIVGAAIASVFRAVFARRRRGPERPSRSSGLPPDSSSPPTRLNVLPTWLRA